MYTQESQLLRRRSVVVKLPLVFGKEVERSALTVLRYNCVAMPNGLQLNANRCRRILATVDFLLELFRDLAYTISFTRARTRRFYCMHFDKYIAGVRVEILLHPGYSCTGHRARAESVPSRLRRHCQMISLKPHFDRVLCFLFTVLWNSYALRIAENHLLVFRAWSRSFDSPLSIAYHLECNFNRRDRHLTFRGTTHPNDPNEAVGEASRTKSIGRLQNRAMEKETPENCSLFELRGRTCAAVLQKPYFRFLVYALCSTEYPD